MQFELGPASELAMVITLALMMFAVALGLRLEQFVFFKTRPQVFLAGAVSQVIALPLLTLALCFWLQPPASMALGMILVASCPGGNVSNLLVVLARGNAALSVSLTATSSLIAAFLTPFLILFWSALYPPTATLLTQIAFDSNRFLLQTMMILALPLISGMLLAKFLPRLSDRIRPILMALASLGLFGIITGSLYRHFEIFLSLSAFVLGTVVLHNALAFLLGFCTAKLVRADAASTRALTFEVGIQNAGLGIVILLTQLGGLGGAAAVAGLWGIWHIIAGLMLVAVFRRVRL